jgi:hypothetical protein
MLTCHPELHITYETGFPATARYQYRPMNIEPTLQAIAAIPQFKGIDIDGLRDDILSDVAVNVADVTALAYRRLAALHGKTRWGDKTPAYTSHIPHLATMFPAAQFIHVVRDPRSVAASWLPAKWGPNTYWHAGRWWEHAVGLATVDMAIIEPERRCTIKFEDVVRAPEQTMRGVCDFLGMQWDPRVLSADARSAVAMPSIHDESLHEKSRKEVDVSRSDSWRHVDSRKLRHLEAVCWDLMKFYGYEPLSEKPMHPTPYERFRYKVTDRLLNYGHQIQRYRAGIRPPTHQV